MCPEPETSLSELVSAGLMQFIVHIEEVSATATKEFALEETLKRMQAEWNDVCFEFLPYRYEVHKIFTFNRNSLRTIY